MIQYRNLPAQQIVPSWQHQYVLPEDAKIVDLSISSTGEIYWSYHEKGKGSTICDESGRAIDLRSPLRERFLFPIVQRFRDGRWLATESRNLATGHNAFIFDPEFKFMSSFYAGDGIQSVLVDENNKIWIGYFDEGIFGALNPMPPKSDPYYRFGPNGLVRVDDGGNIEFTYNDKHPDKSISEIQAMTIDNEDNLWFSPYTDFFVAQVHDNRVNYVLPRSPAPLEDALSIGQQHFAFFGGYQRTSMVAFVARTSQRLRLIQLLRDSGDTFSPARVATRSDKAVAIADNRLYRLDQDVLLHALGPWTETNSSSVASANQYQDEEDSYSGSYAIYPGQGSKLIRKPRPLGVKTREDKDTGL